MTGLSASCWLCDRPGSCRAYLAPAAPGWTCSANPRWWLGGGSGQVRPLSLAVNFGDEKPALPQPEGDSIFEYPVGAWDTAMYGMLLERSAVAWIEPTQ